MHGWHRDRIALPILTAAAAIMGAIQGCASSPGRIIDSPLSTEQQQQAILELVPIGTSRAEAEKRLHDAGVSVTPGANQTICYIALWNRENGDRWEMDVALLFDREGRLYRARPASATTDPELMQLKNTGGSAPQEATATSGSGWQPAGAPRMEPTTEERPRVAFPGSENTWTRPGARPSR